jgi:hypothetical protein
VRPGKSLKEDDAASNRLSSCKVAILLAYERPDCVVTFILWFMIKLCDMDMPSLCIVIDHLEGDCDSIFGPTVLHSRGGE